MIRITNENGEGIYLAKAHIVALISSTRKGCMADILVTSGLIYSVRESKSQILDLLRE